MWLEVALLLLTLFLAVYWFIVRNFGKFEALGIPCKPGRFPYGSHAALVTQSMHTNEYIEQDYHRFKQHKLSGFYMLGKPVLMINDLDLVRHVMVKDFDHFVDRNDSNIGKAFQGGELDEMWSKQLTSLTGDTWKDVRSSFSPIFTSGKMKWMLRFIVEVSDSLTNELGKKADSNVDFELKEVFGKFSLDSLASCALGINPKSFESGDSRFVRYAARLFQNTIMDMLKIFTRFLPGGVFIHRALGLNIFKPTQTKFFVEILRKTVEERRRQSDKYVRRNDLIDLMIDCMKNPDQTVDAKDNAHHHEQYESDMRFEHKKQKGISEDYVIASAMVVLVAGYDTTGMTLSFMAYYLATHPEVQSALQDEIDAAFEENDGKLPDYNTILELPYLEQCILETLRMSTPLGLLIRGCVKDYVVPGTNIQVKVNDLVGIPVSGIHKDPDIYPNPTQFNPDNFSKEARQARNPYAFQAFGQGPRACIGMRFAMLELKVAMMEVLHNFTLIKSDKNPVKHTIDPVSQMGYVKEGLHVKVVRR